VGRDLRFGQGFVKWYRSAREHWTHFLQQKRPATDHEAFLDLIQEANYTRTSVERDGKIIPINRGQVLTTEDNLAKRWRWSRGKVRRFLRAAQGSAEIQRETVQGITILTLCNYDKWQSDGTGRGTSHGTTDGTHLKKEKERERSSGYHKTPEQIEELRQKLGLPPEGGDL
jgi:hypothetical protein